MTHLFQKNLGLDCRFQANCPLVGPLRDLGKVQKQNWYTYEKRNDNALRAITDLYLM